MKEKKTWSERWREKLKEQSEAQTPYEEMLDAVIDARENNPTVIPQPQVTFTPGVPTEDGWYVVKVGGESNSPFYTTCHVLNGVRWGSNGTILSHAKLPEL